MTQKILFICTQNRLRSPTAEQVFSTYDGLECDSAGLAPDAVVSLSAEQITWADVIFVMEKAHRNKLSKKFKTHLKGKRVIVLGIPDDFEFMEEGLVRLLKVKVPQFLR
ncbi:MAG: low molecular weight protein tyrosine phosphatase family protein [Pseudomonadota bacterium]